ncbi:MAG: aminotransferase class III-fold pyridoxal phosphate-dependent enzyme, partial [Puia sp.]
MKLFDVYPLNEITITRAKGSYLWTMPVSNTLDMYGGHAVISIGHTHPHFVSRITHQLNQVAFYSNRSVYRSSRNWRT